jgi:putative ABC transport system ATP-binding protein
MGFVFQSVALITSMTAFENVEFALRVAGADARGRRERSEEVLELVGLEKRMKHRTQELSGGEQQRVAIARAISHRPTVVFADEPTAELDTNMGLQVVSLLRSLVEKEGLTVIMTTHDPNMIELADLVFSLDSGVMQND